MDLPDTLQTFCLNAFTLTAAPGACSCDRKTADYAPTFFKCLLGHPVDLREAAERLGEMHRPFARGWWDFYSFDRVSTLLLLGYGFFQKFHYLYHLLWFNKFSFPLKPFLDTTVHENIATLLGTFFYLLMKEIFNRVRVTKCYLIIRNLIYLALIN